MATYIFGTLFFFSFFSSLTLCSTQTGFLRSIEYQVYQKRCSEIAFMLENGINSDLSLGNDRFTGMGGQLWPITPTTSLLDDLKLTKKLNDNSIEYTLDLVCDVFTFLFYVVYH